MKRALITLGILALWAGATVPTHAAFEDIGGSTRGRAMGNAIFADFDGAATMMYNPANLALLRSIQTYLSWDTPYTGLNDQSGINTFNVNFCIPFWNSFTIPPDNFFTKRAALGLSFHRLGVGGVDVDGTETEFYHEGVYSLYYAKDLHDVISKGAKLALGFRFALYDIGVGNTVDVQANEAFTQLGRLSFGMDIGATYDFSETIHLGLAYRNLISPNISIMPDGTDTLPSELSFGVNWELGNLLIFKKSHLGFGIVAYGRDATDNRQAEMAWNLGYEFRQLTASELFKGNTFAGEMLAVRMGFSYQAKKIGDTLDLWILQLQGSFGVSGGIGFNYVFNQQHQLVLDYAIEYGLNSGALKHTVALMYNLLLPGSSFIYREEQQKRQQMDELIKGPAPATNKAPAPAPAKPSRPPATRTTNR